MGILNETKSRRKLQKDPNNTKWTRDTNTFGQKILRAQGWQPGEFLGAKDAPHSELHGAANASYIRVALKDDMKGLGFDRRKDDEVTGLAEFSDVLSRLNGKSNKKIEEEKAKRIEVKMNAYVQHRYGAMRFVRGGLLVGDEMKTDNDKKDESDDEEEPAKVSKKRKAESLSDDEDSAEKDDESERKKRRKEKKSKKRSSSEDDTPEDLQPKSKKKDKRSKSRSRGNKSASADEDMTDRKSSKSKRKAASSPDSSEDDEPSQSKSERKEEKRARKEQKKKDKEEKKRKKAEAKALTESASGVSSALPSSSASTPAGSGSSTPRPINRGHVRSRFLAAKREALMNDKALAKIWMVKT